jgi:hypothetical protein
MCPASRRKRMTKKSLAAGRGPSHRELGVIIIVAVLVFALLPLPLPYYWSDNGIWIVGGIAFVLSLMLRAAKELKRWLVRMRRT